MTLKHLRSVALITVILGITGTASGEIVTHYFEGTVTSASGNPFGLVVAVGAEVEGSLTYDTSLPPAYDTGSLAGYTQPSPSGMVVEIGGMILENGGDASLQVSNDYFSSDGINGYFNPVLADGVPMSGAISFNLSDSTATVFTSTALPDILDAADFSLRIGSIFQDTATISFSIDTLYQGLPTLAVTIDIKPGGSPNTINPNSGGGVTVAILTTEHFDATTVDPVTVMFGATGTEAYPLRWALQDVDTNGDLDLILKFRIAETGIICGTNEAFLTGATMDAQFIEGSDYIQTVPCR